MERTGEAGGRILWHEGLFVGSVAPSIGAAGLARATEAAGTAHTSCPAPGGTATPSAPACPPLGHAGFRGTFYRQSRGSKPPFHNSIAPPRQETQTHKHQHSASEQGQVFPNTEKSINCRFYCTQDSDVEVRDGMCAAWEQACGTCGWQSLGDSSLPGHACTHCSGNCCRLTTLSGQSTCMIQNHNSNPSTNCTPQVIL